MAKKRLTEDQYLAELNRELRAHKDYKPGMEFVAWPPNSTGKGMTGYDMKGRFDNWEWIGIYANVAHKVRDSYELLI